jgi:misacylated tRNA(Ala) deacylase
MENIDANYIKEFEAIVTKKKKDYLIFDKTAFYPEGGGQPSDKGSITWDNNKIEIFEVLKKGDSIQHKTTDDHLPIPGTKISASLDWETRYNHMKMHTAQHIISGVVFDLYQARTVGNQIHTDYSRVDFQPLNVTENDLDQISDTCNEIIHKNLPVKIYTEERSSIEKKVDQQRCNLDLLPNHITSLRIIEIEGFDICPCAGTHIKNTKEIPSIKIIKRENKGKNRVRIIYTFR